MKYVSYYIPPCACFSVQRDVSIDIDVLDKKGHTPLLTAALSGSVDAFQFLMVCGANIEATDKNGKTVAILAAECNNAQILEVSMYPFSVCALSIVLYFQHSSRYFIKK